LEDEGGSVNAREVASAGGLVLLGLQAERVHVDTGRRGNVLVVLVGLHQVEVGTITLVEAIVAVELHLGSDNGVATGGIARSDSIGVVEGIMRHSGSTRESAGLDDPDQFFTWVIEVQLDLVVGARGGFVTGKLELLDQILVRDLGEAAALISVKIDVVYPERAVAEAGGGDRDSGNGGDDQRGEGLELNVHLNLVVLEGNQGESQARVAAEPELEGHVDSEATVRVGSTIDHGVVAHLVTLGLGQVVPDVEPVGVVLVNALATDFELNRGEHGLTDVADEVATNQGREGSLEVHAVDKVTVTRDRASHLAAEISSAVEGLLDGLHREVGMASIDDFEDIFLFSKRKPSLSGYLIGIGLYLKQRGSKIPTTHCH